MLSGNAKLSYLLVMPLSWILASRAEPSWKFAEPSRAELANFKKRAEYELNMGRPTTLVFLFKKPQLYPELLIFAKYAKNWTFAAKYFQIFK